ncbi:MAG: DUF1116 domain-containing protein [Planctomycetota bacterium]
MSDAIRRLLGGDLCAVNLGLGSFAASLEVQDVPVVHVDWRPPAGGDPAHLALLERLMACDAANEAAAERLRAAEPKWVDVAIARDAIPAMTERTILHAGPPVAWEHMCGPVRGSVVGALIYEGLAGDEREATELAGSGRIAFEPCHHHSAVGPMAGIISPSMPVIVVEDAAGGGRSYATFNEGLGKVLRFGAYGPEVVARLRWMAEELAPALKAAVRRAGGVNLRAIMSRALHMGDECHNRNVAATSLLMRTLTPYLVEAVSDRGQLGRVCAFIASNDHFFLNFAMAAAKASLDAIAGLASCSLVSAMARNGTEFGIRVCGCGDRWFTAPAGRPVGLYFPGYTAADANPDLGDSAITETAGLGGFAIAAAPAIVQFVGGSPADAIRQTEEMYEITWMRSPHYTLPALDFAGSPTAIDIRIVLEVGITPAINTGIAHRDPGVGQVGAGLIRAPLEPFVAAAEVLAEMLGR